MQRQIMKEGSCFIESNLMIEMNEEFLSLGLLPISGRYPHISEAPGGCVHNSAV